MNDSWRLCRVFASFSNILIRFIKNSYVKKIIVLTLLFVLILSLPCQAVAQTFHLILATDTNDEVIGSSCFVDNLRILAEMQNVAKTINYDLNTVNVSGYSFTKNNLMEAIFNLRPESEDIVMFYFSGNEYSDYNSNNNLKWPVLKFPSGIIQLTEVHSILLDKSQKLLITIADCSQIVVSASESISDNIVIIPNVFSEVSDNYHNLFLTSREKILIASAEKGQTSFRHDQKGGYLTMEFIEALRHDLNIFDNISWSDLFYVIENRLKGLDYPDGPQVPIFSFGQDYLPSKSTPLSHVIEVHNESAGFNSADDYLNMFINENITLEQRRANLDKDYLFFENRAIVGIYKENQLVEYQLVEDYLARLFLNASSIKKIYLIENKSEKGHKGKYKKIAIQEIWK